MRNTEWGEVNRGALAGVMVGAIGGMFALQLARSILYRDLVYLVNTPKLTLTSFLVCAVAGWYLGGQLGPQLRRKLRSQTAELAGGALGGLLIVLTLMFVGWQFLPSR